MLEQRQDAPLIPGRAARLVATVKTAWGFMVLAILLAGAMVTVSQVVAASGPGLAKLRFAVYLGACGGLGGLLLLALRSRSLLPSLAVLVPWPGRFGRFVSGSAGAVAGCSWRWIVMVAGLQALALLLAMGGLGLWYGVGVGGALSQVLRVLVSFNTVGAVVPVPVDAHVPVLAGLALPFLLSTLSGVALGWGPGRGTRGSWVPSPTDVRAIRALVLHAGVTGAAGGLTAGAVVGLLEAAWCYHFLLRHATELRLFWWGPLAYGLVLAPVGAAVGLGVAFLKLSRTDRRLPLSAWSLGAGVVLAAGLLVIGRFRVARELLSQRALPLSVVIGLVGGGGMILLGALVPGVPQSRRLGVGKSLFVSAFAYFILVIVGAGLGLMLVSPEQRQGLSDAPAAITAPDIVLIVADALRADGLKSYNPDAPAETPNLSRLAAEGVRFDQHYAQASWTKPSFATLLTGRYPGDHGAESKAAILPEELETLPEVLAAAGYETRGFANNRNLLPEYRLDQGFTHYDYLMPHLYLGGSFSVEQLALYQVLRRAIIGLYGFKVDIDHFYRPAEAVTRRALDWLETAPRTRPRFAMIHYMDPHDPYMLHDGSGVGYTSALIGANPDPAQWRDTLEAAYHREVAYLDEHLGPLLEALDDTIVVFTGDHGEEFYEHGGWFHGPTVYEEVLRVPLIVRFPGGEGGGRVSTALARHVDFMPTVLRWAGLEASPELPGVPLFDDAGNLTETGPYSYAETDFLGNIGYGLRSEDHKLIEANPGNPSGMPVTGFYEMAPGAVEGANIAGSGGAEESRMTSALHAIRRAVGEM